VSVERDWSTTPLFKICRVNADSWGEIAMKKAVNLFTDMFGKMSTGAKGALLVVGAYVVTIGVAVFIAVLAIMILMMGSHSCSTMGQALVALWVTIAAVFLASAAVVGVVAWKIVEGTVGRLAIVGVYGVVTFASYVVIAFVLMVAFNC